MGPRNPVRIAPLSKSTNNTAGRLTSWYTAHLNGGNAPVYSRQFKASTVDFGDSSAPQYQQQ